MCDCLKLITETLRNRWTEFLWVIAIRAVLTTYWLRIKLTEGFLRRVDSHGKNGRQCCHDDPLSAGTECFISIRNEVKETNRHRDECKSQVYQDFFHGVGNRLFFFIFRGCLRLDFNSQSYPEIIYHALSAVLLLVKSSPVRNSQPQCTYNFPGRGAWILRGPVGLEHLGQSAIRISSRTDGAETTVICISSFRS